MFLAPQERLRTRLFRGPSAFMPKAQKEFMKMHGKALGITVIEDRLYALEKNRYESVSEVMKDAASGKIKKRHKDVTISGAKLFVNKVPSAYAELVYEELTKKLSL